MSAGVQSGQNDRNKHRNPRVMMWCVPRSVSTAVTKCLSFVEGAEVWLEPYYTGMAAGDSYCRVHQERDFPLEIEGNEEVFKEAAKILNCGRDDLDACHLDMLSPVVLKRIFDELDPAKKFIFIKDLGIGMPPSRYQYLPDRSSGIKHFFLIRHPVKAYKSLRKCLLDFILNADPESLPAKRIPDSETFHVIKDAPSQHEGTQYIYKAIHELWIHIRKSVDYDPVIVDIDDLLENPSAMLPRVCNAVGIPYSESLLSWDASSDVVMKWKSSYLDLCDSHTYATWFKHAFTSTCFKASSTMVTLEDATNDIKEVVEKEMPFYEEMYNQRLTV